MSFVNAHQSIQKTVLNYAKTDYRSPMLLAVLLAAAQNNKITARDNGTEAGKLRALKMTYLPPVCDYDASCATTNLCDDAGTVDEPLQVNFAITKCTASRIVKVPIEEMRNFDTVGLPEYFAATLANHLRAASNSLAKAVGAFLIASAGNHMNGTAVKIANLINGTTGAINPVGKSAIEKEFEDAELTTPIVVGGDSVYLAKSLLPANGLGANGINGNVPMGNFFYDKLVNQLYGTGENMLAFDPTMFKFVSWNANAGRFATDDTDFNPQTAFEKKDTYYYGSIVDPLTGLLWDLDAVLDTCGKFWKFQFKLNWDIFFMPNQTCLPAGVNGIMHFTGCAVPAQVCPPVV